MKKKQTTIVSDQKDNKKTASRTPKSNMTKTPAVDDKRTAPNTKQKPQQHAVFHTVSDPLMEKRRKAAASNNNRRGKIIKRRPDDEKKSKPVQAPVEKITETPSVPAVPEKRQYFLNYESDFKPSAKRPTDRKKDLKIIFLGGVGEIGKNMTALEYDGNVIVIDAGMTFPTDDMPGVDYIIPDLTYLNDENKKVRALLLTHGHEDHIGAIRFFVKSFPYVPIYGSEFTLALVEHKLNEAGIPAPQTFVVENGSNISIAPFSVEFLNVSHSISGALALSITTPKGVVFHTGDFKIDYTPIDNRLINLPRMAEIGKKGVALMLCESTNIEREGYTMSERTVGQSFDRLFGQNTDKRIIIATFASNVQRLQQIVNVARKYSRQVALAGRSMQNIYDIAVKLGEIHEPEGVFVDLPTALDLPDNKVVIVVTGSQGEPLSALSRMADGKFNKLTIGPGDTVIMSSTPIPGNERTVYNTINKLSRLGATVLYESLHDLHVSGHACREELKLIHSLIKPKYFIPVHGEYRHLRKHAELAESLGMARESIAIVEVGDCLSLTKNGLEFLPKVPAGDMFVDGLTIDNMSSVILKDRRRLSGEGVLLVIVGVNADTGKIDSKPDFILKGLSDFPADVLIEAEKIVAHIVEAAGFRKTDDAKTVDDGIIKAMRSYLSRTLKLNPMIIPIVLTH